ncbi:hypothetical protein HUU42_03780 [bacterium]|nr:hypothetical protein [bacterium]
MKKILFGLWVVAGFIACSGSTDHDDLSYALEIVSGWNALANAHNDSAIIYFENAINFDSNSAIAFAGLGWAEMRLNDLNAAAETFQRGSTKHPVPSDLFAGWAFLLNAMKNYATSNSVADSALAIDAGWEFTVQSAINWQDLTITKAANYYALGDYVTCLEEVKILNPDFVVNIGTDIGQAALGAEIERLRGILAD